MDCVRLLLQAGADPNVQSALSTALSLARSVECAKLLLEHGADIDAVNYEGNTALVILATEDFKTAMFLVESGANVELCHSTLGSPLIQAAKFGAHNLVELLLDYGANLEAVNSSGLTPFLAAVRDSSIRTIQLLLKRGANAKAEHVGSTALHYICYKNKDAGSWEDTVTLLRLLAQHKLDFNARDLSGNSPLSFAIEDNDAQMAEMLLKHGATDTGKRQASAQEIARGEMGGLSTVFREHFSRVKLRKVRAIACTVIVFRRYREDFYRCKYIAIGSRSFATGKRKLRETDCDSMARVRACKSNDRSVPNGGTAKRSSTCKPLETDLTNAKS